MSISLIVAMSQNRVIGLNNQMPWHLSADLKHFRKITTGFPIIMGRKTYEAIGKILPNRTNIIISRNVDYKIEGGFTFQKLEDGFAFAKKFHDDVFVIGGATLYETTLSYADYLYLTLIEKTFEGDTYFPEIDFTQWQEIERISICDDQSVDFNYTFLKLKRLP